MIMTLLILYTMLIATELIGADEKNRCPPHIANNLYLWTRADRCYQFIFMEDKGFGDKTYCEQRGGALITIKQPITQTVFGQSLPNFTWTGSKLRVGSATHSSQNWKYAPGFSVNNAQPWGRNVSNGNGRLEDGSSSCDLPEIRCQASCVCLRLEGQYVWHLAFCSANVYEYGFICQYEMIQETTCSSTASPTPTQNTTRVSHIPDSTRADGAELKTEVNIGKVIAIVLLLVLCLSLVITASILCYLWKHVCTSWHERNIDVKMRHSKTSVPSDDAHVCSDLLGKDWRSRTVCSISIQEASSDAESFKSVGSRGSSDSLIGSKQFVTSLHANGPCTGVHMDDKCSLDQPQGRPVQENQTSRQPIDPADLNATTFATLFNNQLDQYY